MAMLPDVASRSADARTRIGLYTGVWTAGETLGLALGPGLYAAVLASGGYVSSSAGSAVRQGDSALNAIVLGFSLVPAVLVALSLLALHRFPDPGHGAGGGPLSGSMYQRGVFHAPIHRTGDEEEA